jgi:hypothetical protein
MSANLNQPIIRRTYRHAGPTKFHALNQRIMKALTNNSNIPDSVWSANPALLPSYLSASEKHDAVYHQALYGHKLDIAQRDLLQAQITAYLDEMAVLLEAAAFYTPQMLLTTGFDLAKERRGRPRGKVASTDSEEIKASDAEVPSSG